MSHHWRQAKKPGDKGSSPVASVAFARVEILKDAKVNITRGADKYFVEAAIPWEALGIKPQPGLELRGDAGFISSDAEGQTNTGRTYWSNSNTGLVNDLPGEAAIKPSEWGVLQLSD